jgi:hypothetical protein
MCVGLLTEFELVGEICDSDDERWAEGRTREDRLNSCDCDWSAEKSYGCVCFSGIEYKKMEESSKRGEAVRRFDGTAEVEAENGEELLKIWESANLEIAADSESTGRIESEPGEVAETDDNSGESANDDNIEPGDGEAVTGDSNHTDWSGESTETLTLDDSDFVIALTSESVREDGNPDIEALLGDDDPVKRGDSAKPAEGTPNISDED